MREALGLSQSELARLAGCSPSYINKIELGERGVGLATALKLQKVTGIKASAWVADAA